MSSQKHFLMNLISIQFSLLKKILTKKKKKNSRPQAVVIQLSNLIACQETHKDIVVSFFLRCAI